jgi:hypothetical protein
MSTTLENLCSGEADMANNMDKEFPKKVNKPCSASEFEY